MESSFQYLRFLSHGMIADLSNGFKRDYPFSIYIRPKETTMQTDVTVSCRLVCDESNSAFPVPLSDWTPAAIVEIAPNAISLADYDVYWGAGNPKII